MGRCSVITTIIVSTRNFLLFLLLLPHIIWLRSHAPHIASASVSSPPLSSTTSSLPSISLGCASGVRDLHILSALSMGYRSLDTAQNDKWGYDEASVGRALIRSGVPRSDIYLQTKVDPQHYLSVTHSVQRSLKRLQTDYIDSVILHSPQDGWKTAWRSLEDLVERGAVLHIGVSNFDSLLLRELVEDVATRVRPFVVQNWMDPFHQDAVLRDLCRRYGIEYQAYSSLGNQWFARKGLDPAAWTRPFVSNSDVLSEIAMRYGISVPALVYKWQSQIGVAVIPTSRSSSRQRENLSALLDSKLVLKDTDIEAIANLDGLLDVSVDVDMFNDDTEHLLQIHWYNFVTGTYVWTLTIPRGERRRLSSYVGHKFRATYVEKNGTETSHDFRIGLGVGPHAFRFGVRGKRSEL